ncbi:hypothetical protein ACFYTF_07530 [Nocardia thailandica]|uniref:Secreted protein n=1 Tax=Nocardia thailandica TaxID=257275 RepID=A0ABW6PJY5_9NOCA
MTALIVAAIVPLGGLTWMSMATPSPSTSDVEESGSMGAQPADNDDAVERELLDAEEPIIDGAPPITSDDFYRDSLDGADQGEWTPGSSGVSGSGWTATDPE